LIWRGSCSTTDATMPAGLRAGRPTSNCPPFVFVPPLLL
jgi:hypothetical protein